MATLLTILGTVLVLEGIPWFLSPPKVRALLAELSRWPDVQLRIGGLLAMASGLLLVWAGTG